MMLWLHIIGVRDRLSQGGQSQMLLLEFYATPQLKKGLSLPERNCVMKDSI